jgi:hypothetical protein
MGLLGRMSCTGELYMFAAFGVLESYTGHYHVNLAVFGIRFREQSVQELRGSDELYRKHPDAVAPLVELVVVDWRLGVPAAVKHGILVIVYYDCSYGHC